MKKILFFIILSFSFVIPATADDLSVISSIMLNKNIKQPSYIGQCNPDPYIVWEYILVLEIDYLTSIKNDLTFIKNTDGYDSARDEINEKLQLKLSELEKLQKKCITEG